MAKRMTELVQHLRRAMLERDGGGLTDGQLLERFLAERDEAAVAALVRRHSPMVWGVCRRVLGNYHDAEDAFQATFLVLVRRAAAIVPREMVGNWLYGVAHQTALKARATLAKRRTREKQIPVMPEIGVEPQNLGHELQLVLDQELSRLPDMYRAAIVLCDLEGRSRTEAARQLGIPPGTLATRLTRGRALLARRLIRHGLAVSGGMLATVLSEQGASACRPESLMASTIKAVTSVAAGQAASTGMISVQVAALTEGMIRTMMQSKIKFAMGLLLALTVSTAGGWLYTTRAEDPPRVEQKGQDDLRAAALKALEQLGKSESADDREAAIQALVDYRRKLKAEESRKAEEEARLVHERERRLASAVRDLGDLFMFKVPIELGETEFHEGGRIDIVGVWGTRPRIEIGGQYLVRGKYKLPPGQRHGKIYFYATAGGTWGSIGTTLDLQSTSVDKPEGEFTLVHGMLGEGYFHLVLADPERYSRTFANVYFGTGKNVLRKKSW
jgi:RNA polymerase sigma factor (sigma-70 family)